MGPSSATFPLRQFSVKGRLMFNSQNYSAEVDEATATEEEREQTGGELEEEERCQA